MLSIGKSVILNFLAYKCELENLETPLKKEHCYDCMFYITK